MLQSGRDCFGASARSLQSWKIHLRRLATTAQSQKDDLDRDTSGWRRTEPRFTREHDSRQRGNIPFETFRDVVPQRKGADATNTTITRREGAAFRKLQELAAFDQPVAGKAGKFDVPGPTRQSSPLSALDDLLDNINGKAAGISYHTPEFQKSASTKSDPINYYKYRHKPGEISNPGLQERRQWRLNQNSVYRKVALNIEQAYSDGQIWEILQKEVFKPVADLQLEGPAIKLAGFPGAKLEQFLDLGVLQIDPLETIGGNFAQILRTAAQVLRKAFPTSPLQLSIIPELRKLGPTYFALGVTTEVYNCALEHIIQNDQDLSAGLDILDEMDREVIEPNEKTLSILLGVVHQARTIMKGEYGHGVRIVWQTERNRTALKEFRYRAKKLEDMFRKPERGSEQERNAEMRESWLSDEYAETIAA